MINHDKLKNRLHFLKILDKNETYQFIK